MQKLSNGQAPLKVICKLERGSTSFFMNLLSMLLSNTVSPESLYRLAHLLILAVGPFQHAGSSLLIPVLWFIEQCELCPSGYKKQHLRH